MMGQMGQGKKKKKPVKMYRASWATARESAPPQKQFLCQERAVGGLSAPSPSGSGVPSFAQARGSDANSWSHCHRRILSQPGGVGPAPHFHRTPRGTAHTWPTLSRACPAAHLHRPRWSRSSGRAPGFANFHLKGTSASPSPRGVASPAA